MKVRNVMAGSSRGMENNDASCVEFDAGTGVENIFETSVTGWHEGDQQCGIAVEPYSKELRCGQ